MVSKLHKLVGKIKTQLWTISMQLEARNGKSIFSKIDLDEIQKDVESFTDKRLMNFIETLDYLKKNKASFARFGDGELRMMLRPKYSLKFQQNSKGLRDGLHRVIDSGANSQNNLLIGFPHPFNDMHWKVIWAQIWDETKALFSQFENLGDAHVSRPIVFQQHRDEAVAKWRSLWVGLNVKVITGEGSRFELVPELFDNAASIGFIWSSPINGFEDIPRILEIAKTDSADLYLISLGPAGTVLAAELASKGKWALDIGHLSDSYLNVYKSAPRPESNPIVRLKE